MYTSDSTLSRCSSAAGDMSDESTSESMFAIVRLVGTRTARARHHIAPRRAIRPTQGASPAQRSDSRLARQTQKVRIFRLRLPLQRQVSACRNSVAREHEHARLLRVQEVENDRAAAAVRARARDDSDDTHTRPHMVTHRQITQTHARARHKSPRTNHTGAHAHATYIFSSERKHLTNLSGFTLRNMVATRVSSHVTRASSMTAAESFSSAIATARGGARVRARRAQRLCEYARVRARACAGCRGRARARVPFIRTFETASRRS
jgi:hypothetical protein